MIKEYNQNHIFLNMITLKNHMGIFIKWLPGHNQNQIFLNVWNGLLSKISMGLKLVEWKVVEPILHLASLQFIN